MRWDTLDYAKKLATAGVPVPQAAAQGERFGGRIDRLSGSVDTLKCRFGFIATLDVGILGKLLLNR